MSLRPADVKASQGVSSTDPRAIRCAVTGTVVGYWTGSVEIHGGGEKIHPSPVKLPLR